MQFVLLVKYFFIFIIILLGNNNKLYAELQITSNSKEELSTNYLTNYTSSEYILGPGDFLQISVSPDHPELITDVFVDREGTISLPTLRKIYVSGLSNNELTDLLNKAYKEFVKYPDVTINIKRYRPIKVYLYGEVENPGLVSIDGQIEFGESNQSIYFPTVFDAIKKAGGITENADLSNLELIRIDTLSNGGMKKVTNLNFENLILKGDLSQNIRVYDKDIIQIRKGNKYNINLIKKAIASNLNPSFINVYVTGRVKEPGKIQITKLGTLNDAIAIAGGTKAIKGPVQFIRTNNEGEIDIRKIRYRNSSKRGSKNNPYLKNGDLIFVGENILTISNEIISEVTKPFVGVFSTYGLYKSITD